MNKLALILALSLVLSGCGPQATSGPSASKDEYAKGAVVKDFPTLPLYPGSKTIETYGRDKKYGGSFMVSESLSKVVDFYSQALSTSGWRSSLNQVSSTNYVFNISSSAQIGQIIVNTAAGGKQTAITISVEPR
jgi:starvation-inducible outer membrane lipoprotein